MKNGFTSFEISGHKHEKIQKRVGIATASLTVNHSLNKLIYNQGSHTLLLIATLKCKTT